MTIYSVVFSDQTFILTFVNVWFFFFFFGSKSNEFLHILTEIWVIQRYHERHEFDDYESQNVCIHYKNKTL